MEPGGLQDAGSARDSTRMILSFFRIGNSRSLNLHFLTGILGPGDRTYTRYRQCIVACKPYRCKDCFLSFFFFFRQKKEGKLRERAIHWRCSSLLVRGAWVGEEQRVG